MEQLRKLEAEYESLMKDCERLIAENAGLKARNGELRARILELESKFDISAVTGEPSFTSRQVGLMDDEEYNQQRDEIRKARQSNRYLVNTDPVSSRWRRRLGVIEE
jgi:regulator of replication initiation timing